MKYLTSKIFIITVMVGMLFSVGAVTHAFTQSEINVVCSIFDCDDTQRDALEKLLPSTNTDKSCMPFDRSLGIGSNDALSGGDVSRLQTLLRDKGFYTFGSITGYYGIITESAVKKWQAAQGIVSSGSAASTGYGVFGPKTRASACSGSSASVPPTTRTILHLKSPNGGETWLRGTEEDIRWEDLSLTSTNGFADPDLFIDIEIYSVDGGLCGSYVACTDDSQPAAVYTIASNVLNSLGEHEWNVGDISNALYLPEGDYRVRIVNPQTGESDESDALFRVADDITDPPTEGTSATDIVYEPLIVLAPNGGETWTRNMNEDITWSTLFAPVYDLGMKIQLVDANPTLTASAVEDTVFTIDLTVSNTGSYEWNVGSILEEVILPDGKYRVRVIDNTSGLQDDSDSFFTIRTSNPNDL